MHTEISELIGKTFVDVKNLDDTELSFIADNGDSWVFFHSQDCSESVTIEDVCGDLADLVGTPIVMAEEVSHINENPDGVEIPEYQDNFTWTFYKFGTIKGFVTVRWYGESNGYYSESVDIRKVEGEK